MDQAKIDGVTLEYEMQGSGEPVVFIHGALMGDTYAPLMDEPSLKGFRLIRYHRRGFAGSSPAADGLSIAGQAADCLALMRALDAEPAHVVGHSSGGAIALQLALDAPKAVRSLTLLEPALLGVPSGPQFFEQATAVLEVYGAGDKAAAVDAFLQAVCGKGYRDAVDRALPGAMTQAVADSDAFFGVEFPSIGEWTFTSEDAARIKQPVLAVLGANSEAVWPGWAEGHQRLLKWLPQAKPFVLRNAAHLLQVENPSGMANGLAAFLNGN